jgi:hypothetical protein
MWSRVRTLAELALVTSALAAAPLAAQSPTAVANDPAVPVPATGPTRDGLQAGIRLDAARTTQLDVATTAPQQSRRGVGPSVAMIIVGAAAIIIGAAAGGTAATILIIGGAVVGLLGLYRFVQ